MEIKELNLKNKVALITGGAGGIGKSIVENFSHYGASVVVADKSSERCEELQQILKKCSKNYLVDCIDVTQKNEVKNLIKRIETQFNRLDIVVNNVGDFLELIKPFEELDDSEIEDLYSV
ncbi:SDR family oxidoreductase, partial [Gammaproteobacteria bacterium]|nr:SDR family oxidoreductase [Gammaproteobacteria bacterium]